MKRKVPKLYKEIQSLTPTALVGEFKALIQQQCHDAVGRAVGFDVPDTGQATRLRLVETELVMRLGGREIGG